MAIDTKYTIQKKKKTSAYKIKFCYGSSTSNLPADFLAVSFLEQNKLKKS